jgi:hypothetical protein
MKGSSIPAIFAIALVLSPGFARASSAPDPFEEIDALDLQTGAAAVNEGSLRFLTVPPAKSYHTHFNDIRISAESLEDGWITLRQCHENIDPVPAAQVVYRQGGIRDLQIISARGIGRAWVEGHTVQLENVARPARLCVEAQSRAFHATADGIYTLRNGPFMRQFLDGYYPMRVRMIISYPTDLLTPVGNEPTAQTGFDVRWSEGRIGVDALFEGRLQTCFVFCDRSRPACPSEQSSCISD